MSTVPSVQTATRGTATAAQTYADTNESITISTFLELPMYIDWADLAQSQYHSQMNMAELQALKLGESVEAGVLGDHTNWTDVGDDGSGGIASASTTKLTVTQNNIDDIIRGVKRIIRKANGQDLMARNGVFFVWRPEDFELLEGFVQANGTTPADRALVNGTEAGMVYMGAYHYMSNSHTSGHLFAGVRRLHHLGIVRDTYGRVYRTDNPAGSSGSTLSGVQISSRVDYAVKTWTNFAPLLYDINVN